MFDEEFELIDLDGDNGFTIEGIDANDAVIAGSPLTVSGYNVSNAGDINNDGFDDLLIGAPDTSGEDNATDFAGEVYVIFGSADIEDELSDEDAFDLNNLDGDNGFTIFGIDPFDLAGFSVSTAGDFDNDGFDDILIGAPGATVEDPTAVGEAYVIFGNDSFDESLNLDDLNDIDGFEGFTLEGFDPEFFGAGTVVTAAGDLNGDEIADIAIGSPGAENDDGDAGAGQVYVIFGAEGDRLANFGETFELEDLDGTNGFTIDGLEAEDTLGVSVSGVGDVNGDSIDDLLVGAPIADPEDNPNGEIIDAGITYVIFGQAGGGFGSTFDLDDLDGTNGFAINGLDASDNLGLITGAGDFDGDGTNDILVGADSIADEDTTGGELFIIFGGPGLANLGALGCIGILALDELDSEEALVISNFVDGDLLLLPDSINFAGDIDDDGFDDLIIGLPTADPNGDEDAGQVFVLFGDNDLEGTFELDDDFDLDDNDDGFFIEGLDAGDALGLSVSTAGDFNGDGAEDIIVAAPGGDPNGIEDAGESFVIFGIPNPDAPPDAADDAAATLATAPITLDVLANDRDPDGDALTIASAEIDRDTLSSVAVNADNTIAYDPSGQYDALAPGETATERITYTLSDGNGGSATATATVTVTGAADAAAVVPGVTVPVEAAASQLSATLGSTFAADLASPAYAELALSATGAAVFASLNAAIANSPTPDAVAADIASSLGLPV